MKAFLEEYGLTLVAVIVVALLLSIAVFFGTSAKSNIESIFNAFNENARQAVLGSEEVP